MFERLRWLLAGGSRPVRMRLIHQVSNDRPDPLDVWIEPWCRLYAVPPGSRLSLHFDATGPSPLEAVLTAEGLTFWFDDAGEPTADLDGAPVEPLRA